MPLRVKNIPQDDWYKRSFNVLVSLTIQGCLCELITRATRHKSTGASFGHTIKVQGQFYSVPVWAIKEVVEPVEFALNYSI
jgi:hypothetical protein